MVVDPRVASIEEGTAASLEALCEACLADPSCEKGDANCASGEDAQAPLQEEPALWHGDPAPMMVAVDPGSLHLSAPGPVHVLLRVAFQSQLTLGLTYRTQPLGPTMSSGASNFSSTIQKSSWMLPHTEKDGSTMLPATTRRIWGKVISSATSLKDCAHVAEQMDPMGTPWRIGCCIACVEIAGGGLRDGQAFQSAA